MGFANTRKTMIWVLCLFQILSLSLLHFNIVLLVGQSTSSLNTSNNNTTEFFKVTIITPIGDSIRASYINVLANEFMKIGISVEPKILREDDFNNRTFNHTLNSYPTYENDGFDLSLISFNVDTYEYRNFIAGLNVINSGFDYVGYNNPEYVNLVEQFKLTSDSSLRNELLGDISSILYDDLPFLTITHQDGISIHSKDLHVSDKLVEALYFGNPVYLYHLNEISKSKNLTILASLSEFGDQGTTPHIQTALILLIAGFRIIFCSKNCIQEI